MAFKTRARGMWANFQTECHHCGGELTVTNGKPDLHYHQRDEPKTLADIRFALDSK
jgi:hypothetical protein